MAFLFLGFPSSWEKGLAILTGLVLIIMAYRIRFKETPPKEAAFIESGPQSPRVESAGVPPVSDQSHYQNPPQGPDAA